MLGPRFLQMQGPNHSASGEDERRPTDQGEPVSDNAVPDSALAVTLGAATLSGLVAGLGVWVASPRELRALSYGLFAGASVAFVIILILVGVAVATPRPGPTGVAAAPVRTGRKRTDG